MAVSTKEGGKYSHDAEGSNTVVVVYARSEHGIRALKSHFMLKYLTVIAQVLNSLQSLHALPQRWAQDKFAHILSGTCLFRLLAFTCLPSLQSLFPMTQSVWVNINHRALEKKDKIVYFVFVFMHSTTLVETESQEICARNLHVCKQCRSRRRKGKPGTEDLCPSSAASVWSLLCREVPGKKPRLPLTLQQGCLTGWNFKDCGQGRMLQG